jgi:transposase
MRRGSQAQVAAPPYRPQETQHLFGAYNWRTDQVVVHPKPAKTARHFIDFLEHLLLQVYPTQTLVLDNAPSHHSNQMKAFLSLFEQRVVVFWLPPYRPELNLIERFWKHLKDKACANKLFPTLDRLLDNIQRLVTAQNRPGDPSRILFAKYFQ